MRPVARGPDPGGYTAYGFAYRPLVEAIGRYCSFCEAPIKNGQVEHVLPQDHYSGLALSWDNFLLACLNCNATKGAWPTPALGDRGVAYWPDQDNTARAYEYRKHLPPRAIAHLPDAQRLRAEALLSQTGVDRWPDHPRWSEKDDRWELRLEAWDKAIDALADLGLEDTQIHRKRIALQAAATGFWSVWRAVFAGDTDMLRRLNEAFRGTDPACFDANLELVARPGGQL